MTSIVRRLRTTLVFSLLIPWFVSGATFSYGDKLVLFFDEFHDLTIVDADKVVACGQVADIDFGVAG